MTKAKSAIPETVKREVAIKAGELITTVLKPKYVKPPLDHPQSNYITDIYGKWFRDSFVFSAKFCVVHPDALEPSFEWRFARVKFVGYRRFILYFMYHPGKEWVPLYPTPLPQTLEECLAAIRDEPYFTL